MSVTNGNGANGSAGLKGWFVTNAANLTGIGIVFTAFAVILVAGIHFTNRMFEDARVDRQREFERQEKLDVQRMDHAKSGVQSMDRLGERMDGLKKSIDEWRRDVVGRPE